MAKVKNYSYWWDKAGPQDIGADAPLPSRADVVVIGAGYSGLSVALNLSRAGRDVVVIDQDRPGQHASTINFGAAGRTIRPKLSELARSYGIDTAVQIMREAKDWLEFMVEFLEKEKIECGFKRAGRVYCAHTPGAYEGLARSLEFEQKHLSVESHMVPKQEQHTEVGSDRYFGLMVLRDVGHLHPGQYFNGLLRRTLASGSRVFGNARALSFEHGNNGHRVVTSRGEITCKELVLCTNAVTGTHNSLLKYFHRRIIPVNNWTIVTAPLDSTILRSVLPTGRLLLETVLLYTGMRPIEDENRLAIAGRHLFSYDDPDKAAADVRSQISFSFPQLSDVEISHCWNGTFAMTFDWLPHLGRDHKTGVYYLLGLVGTGVPSTAYFGHKLANMMLGRKDGETVFANRQFPTLPFYQGKGTLLLPALRTYYRARDNGARKRALSQRM